MKEFRINPSSLLPGLVLLLLLFSLACPAETPGGLPLTAAERAWISAHPVVRMGLDTGYGPYSFVDELGRPAGLVVDLLKRIESSSGLHFRLITDRNWPQLLQGLRNHSLDAVATVVRLPEREDYIAFTDVYLPTPLVVMTRIDTPPLRSLEDLRHLSLVLVKGYSSSIQLLERFPDLKPVWVDTPLEGLRMVASGRADAYIGVLGVNSFLARHHGLTNLRVNAAVDMETNGQRIGVRRDWPELARILDKAIKAIPASEKEAIFRQWLPPEAVGLHWIGAAGWLMRWWPWLLAALAIALAASSLAWAWGWRLRRELRRKQQDLVQSHRALIHHKNRLEFLLRASPTVLYSLRFDAQGRLVPSWVSENIEREFGFSLDQAQAPDFWPSHIHPDDRKQAMSAVDRLLEHDELTHEYRIVDGHGKVHWVRDELRLLRSKAGAPQEAIGAWHDITREKFEDLLQQTRLRVLERINARHPLEEVLTEIARRLERLRPEIRVSVLLRDPKDGTLKTAAAPSLPAQYNQAVDALAIDGGGPGRDSCGNAMAENRMVVVRDVLEHPYWEGGEALAALADIRACTSLPFHDGSGEVLGTFAVYYAYPTEPDSRDVALLEEFARIAAVAVAGARRQLQLYEANAILEHMQDGVVILDHDRSILRVNPAFERITGYAAEESQGREPQFLLSDTHDQSFYQAVWATIEEAGYWSGELVARRKGGESLPLWVSVSSIRSGAMPHPRHVAVFSDLSEARKSQERIEFLAHYDPLTELPNRRLMQAQIQYALRQADRHATGVALVLLDLDRFNPVNEGMGHEVGDVLLRAVAQRMAGLLRINDTLGRIGSDEFALLLEDVDDDTAVVVVLEKVLHAFSRPFPVGDKELFMTASMGVGVYPRDGEDGNALLQAAESALHSAKRQGGGDFAFYSQSLTERAFERVMLESELRKALERDQLRLYYQPQIDLLAGRLIGAEALLRWEHPEMGMIGPGRFIPLAESTGMMIEIGDWVMQRACAQAQAWRDRGLDLRMAVNVGDLQVRRGVVPQQVSKALRLSGLSADCLELEVVEDVVMDRPGEVATVLEGLRRQGVSIAIDDFGTGYSSLSHLRQLPLSRLKIDKSFVRDIPGDDSSCTIARAVIALANSLELEVLAEGIETPEQQEFLMAEGCRVGQGFLFARPLPASEFEAFAAGWT